MTNCPQLLLLIISLATSADFVNAFVDFPSISNKSTIRLRSTLSQAFDETTKQNRENESSTAISRNFISSQQNLEATSTNYDNVSQYLEDEKDEEFDISLKAHSSSGIDPLIELPALLQTLSSASNDFGLSFHHDTVQIYKKPCRPVSIPGSLGRVLSIHVEGLPEAFQVENDEFLMQLLGHFKECVSKVSLTQPVLVAIQSSGDNIDLESLIEKEVTDYGLRDGLEESSPAKAPEMEKTFIPSIKIELDGAMIEDVDFPGKLLFDTSSILVFDNLLDETLRKRLLNVVKGYPENFEIDKWNDSEYGPDPSRWTRGGLVDVIDEGSEMNAPSCWGLSDEAINDICFGPHPAILEFESKLTKLFHEFIVSRLPEAVLGACVSPLTANAPTHGDSFHYHIDADPLQVPASPWSDIFGVYPNRSRGKPRFVSCLIYLNDEWDGEKWGAPTEFLDPPTGVTYRVLPRPGRCVIMDQDVSHTVVAPNDKAGLRPRYSLVWKLILHPRGVGQDMTDIACGRGDVWPESVFIGSANDKCL
mmetsp:Transcript_6466/g.14043  ORF Transcript_6466/g.14043 Transcript_6466/m.14043 type:complete len:533 (+) Transcript_6466:63-1661(+)